MKIQQFKYRSTAESESLMFDEIKDFLIRNNIPDKMLYNILLAVSEAFTNALIHGNNYDRNKIIEISIAVNNESVYADIIDEGDGDIETIISRKPSDLVREGGRGVDLISHYADEIELKRSQSTGGLHLSLKFDKRKYSQSVLDN